MNWLKKKIIRWVENNRNVLYPAEKGISPVRTGIDVEGLSFNVMPANGGTIVQIRHYDRKLDRGTTFTHVIPDGSDVSEAVGHIVSMELLRS